MKLKSPKLDTILQTFEMKNCKIYFMLFEITYFNAIAIERSILQSIKHKKSNIKAYKKIMNIICIKLINVL